MPDEESKLPAVCCPWWQKFFMYVFIKNKLIELGYIKKEV